MANRGADWIRQAEADLMASRTLAANERFEWAAFAAQQAAEKAVKGLAMTHGLEPWGHAVTMLINAMADVVPLDAGLLDAAGNLDRHYIPARYPNGFAAGAPRDFYTRSHAEDAIRDAEIVIDWCRRHTR